MTETGVTATHVRRALEDARVALERLAQSLSGERRLLEQRAPAQRSVWRWASGLFVAALEQVDATRRQLLREAGYDSPAQAMGYFLQFEPTPDLAALW